MKKRRTLIITLMLVAALALGIGYAAFSSEMIINGEADLNATASQVVFSAADETAETSANVEVTVGGLDTKSLSLDVTGFQNAGDKAVVQAKIKNPHDFPVTISDFTDVDGVEEKNAAGNYYFTITCVGMADGDVIAAGTEKTIVITIVCNATSASTVTENFTIGFRANAT